MLHTKMLFFGFPYRCAVNVNILFLQQKLLKRPAKQSSSNPKSLHLLNRDCSSFDCCNTGPHSGPSQEEPC